MDFAVSAVGSSDSAMYSEGLPYQVADSEQSLECLKIHLVCYAAAVASAPCC